MSVPALHAVLAEGRSPAPAGALEACRAFFWRALLKIRHVPEQLFDVTAFPLVTTLMFTYLFGGALAGSTEAYLQFVLPGILAQTVLMITMYTGVGLNTDVTKGVFDRFRSLPTWRPAPLVGALLGDGVRYTIAGVLVLALGLVLGFRPEGGPVGVVAGLALIMAFAWCLAWVWTFVALLVPTPNTVMGVSMMVLFPLTFVSSVFVDPATMPSWLEAFVGVNPVSVLVEAVRELMAGGFPAGRIAIVLGVGAGIVAVFGPLTMRRYGAER